MEKKSLRKAFPGAHEASKIPVALHCSPGSRSNQWAEFWKGSALKAAKKLLRPLCLKSLTWSRGGGGSTLSLLQPALQV